MAYCLRKRNGWNNVARGLHCGASQLRCHSIDISKQTAKLDYEHLVRVYDNIDRPYVCSVNKFGERRPKWEAPAHKSLACDHYMVGVIQDMHVSDYRVCFEDGQTLSTHSTDNGENNTFSDPVDNQVVIIKYKGEVIYNGQTLPLTLRERFAYCFLYYKATQILYRRNSICDASDEQNYLLAMFPYDLYPDPPIPDNNVVASRMFTEKEEINLLASILYKVNVGNFRRRVPSLTLLATEAAHKIVSDVSNKMNDHCIYDTWTNRLRCNLLTIENNEHGDKKSLAPWEKTFLSSCVDVSDDTLMCKVGLIMANLHLPSYIAGGFPTYKLGLTDTFGDIDVFCLIPHEIEMMYPYIKNRLGESIRNSGDVIAGVMGDYGSSGDDMATFRVYIGSIPGAPTVNLVFMKKPFDGMINVYKDVGKTVDMILDSFDLDICKSVGILYKTNLYGRGCDGSIAGVGPLKVHTMYTRHTSNMRSVSGRQLEIFDDFADLAPRRGSYDPFTNNMNLAQYTRQYLNRLVARVDFTYSPHVNQLIERFIAACSHITSHPSRHHILAFVTYLARHNNRVHKYQSRTKNIPADCMRVCVFDYGVSWTNLLCNECQ